jgi:hypothetical protein
MTYMRSWKSHRLISVANSFVFLCSGANFKIENKYFRNFEKLNTKKKLLNKSNKINEIVTEYIVFN